MFSHILSLYQNGISQLKLALRQFEVATRPHLNKGNHLFPEVKLVTRYYCLIAYEIVTQSLRERKLKLFPCFYQINLPLILCQDAESPSVGLSIPPPQSVWYYHRELFPEGRGGRLILETWNHSTVSSWILIRREVLLPHLGDGINSLAECQEGPAAQGGQSYQYPPIQYYFTTRKVGRSKGIISWIIFHSCRIEARQCLRLFKSFLLFSSMWMQPWICSWDNWRHYQNWNIHIFRGSEGVLGGGREDFG